MSDLLSREPAETAAAWNEPLPSMYASEQLPPADETEDRPARHTLDLGCLRPEVATTMVLALHGRSYMDFCVHIGTPDLDGCQPVTIQTDYEAEPIEIATYALTFAVSLFTGHMDREET